MSVSTIYVLTHPTLEKPAKRGVLWFLAYANMYHFRCSSQPWNEKSNTKVLESTLNSVFVGTFIRQEHYTSRYPMSRPSPLDLCFRLVVDVEVGPSHASADLEAGQGVTQHHIERVGLHVLLPELLREVQRPLEISIEQTKRGSDVRERHGKGGEGTPAC